MDGEVNREALVQKNRTLLAKSIQSSRSRSAVNLLFNYVEEVSTARKDKLLTHPCVGRVKISQGMFPRFRYIVMGASALVIIVIDTLTGCRCNLYAEIGVTLLV